MVSVRRSLKAKRARMEDKQMGAFAVLPQELMLTIFIALSASAEKPADLLNATLVCEEFCRLLLNPQVVKAASAACVSVLPRRWCAAADRFLRYCGDHGNADANCFLGMILFYCFGLQSHGWTRLMMAVRSGHAHAAFSLGVIYYNGSFVGHNDRVPRAAARLFAIAADNGHMGAIRDFAFCVSNGVGMPQNPAAGRQLFLRANLHEFRVRYPTNRALAEAYAHVQNNPGCLTSQLGCFTTVPASLRGWVHPANRFLCEWFAVRPRPFPLSRLLPLCSMPTCGCPETRGLEFLRCHVCGIARYCSRTCQSLHWRTGHTRECVPVHQWLVEAIAHANNQTAAVNKAAADRNNAGGAGAPPSV